MVQDNQNMTETPDETSFEELLNEGTVHKHRLVPGEKIEAVIVKVTDEWIFLDFGGKSEGYLAKKELLDSEGNLTAGEGDTIQPYFLSGKNNELLFTTKVSGSSVELDHLEEAYRSGIPVEALVQKEIKGGFEIKISGKIRGFCPYSQMGLRRIEDPEKYVDSHLPFKIIEYKNSGKDIILSNRAVVEEEQEEKKQTLKKSLKEGSVVKGTVTVLKPFGAFVDIGGIEGLLPVSEIGWGRVEDINDSLSVGQEVEVAVIKLDWEKDKFTFSLKQRLQDPWDNIDTRYSEGSTHIGQVAQLTPFGAFVTLEPGIDGLVHISNMGKGKRVQHPREVLSKGQSVNVRVGSVNLEKKRLSLLLIPDEETEVDPAIDTGKQYKQYINKTENESPQSLGTLGDILKAQLEQKRKRKRPE